MSRSGTLYRIGEIIGVLGIIASLVFVGLEIRQSAAATRAATAAEFSAGFRELNLVLATNPDLAAMVAEYGDDPSRAPAGHQVQMAGLWRGLFQTWSSVYRQYTNGTLNPVLWQTVVDQMVAYAGSADPDRTIATRQNMMRWAWNLDGFLYPADFRAVMDSVLAGHVLQAVR
jgi:hypothetical protein